MTATVTFPGQTPVTVDQPAWVVVGPPDYAPHSGGGIVTLYDVAMQAAIEGSMLTAAPRPSFQRDIRPILERSVKLRWSHNFTIWNAFVPLDLPTLADTGPGAAAKRAALGTRIKSPGLRNFVMPAFLETYLNQWIAGDFISDLQTPVPPVSAAEALDGRRWPRVLAELLPRDRGQHHAAGQERLRRAVPAESRGGREGVPGVLSEIMALPWQADFMECDEGGGGRPSVLTSPCWRPRRSRAARRNGPTRCSSPTIRAWSITGIILASDSVPAQAGGQTVFVEEDRDPEFKRE